MATKKQLQCKDCDYSTASSSSFTVHKRIHQRAAGIVNAKLYNVCDVCGKRYNSKACLKQHAIRVHLGLTPDDWKCNACGETFVCKSSLRRHKTKVHVKDPRLTCPRCGRECADAYAFKVHARVHDAGAAPYMCATCGKRLKSAQSLGEHERIHSGEAPFECAECDYKAKSSSALNTHRIAKHGKQQP